MRDKPAGSHGAQPWREVRLGDVMSTLRNGTASQQVKETTPYPVTRIETISDGFVDIRKVGYLLRPEPGHLLRRGDILYSHINSLKHMGKVAYVDECSALFHGMNLLLIRIEESQSDPRFCFRVLQSDIGRAHARRECKSAINQASLNHTDVAALTFRLPPLPEQRRIAEILDTLDEAIRKTERVISKLQQMKQGLLHDLLTRGIDENGELRDPERRPEQFQDSPLGRIPKEWEVLSLGSLDVDLIDGDRGHEYPKSTDFLSDGFCLFLSAENVTREGFVFDETVFISESKHRRLRKGTVERGDIVVTTRGTLGNFGYFDDTIQFDVLRINSGMVIIRSAGGRVATPFLYEVLRSGFTERQIDLNGYGSAQPQLNLGILARLLVAVPPKHEQDMLLEAIRAANERLRFEDHALRKLRTCQQGLTNDLLTGRVRVHVPLAADA